METLMKKKRKLQLKIVAGIIFCSVLTLLAGRMVWAETTDPDSEPLIVVNDETEDTADNWTQDETDRTTERDYLFVGNSLTFYNNMPEMFSDLVQAGTGQELSPTLLVYDSRSLAEHADAIEAVIRTKGEKEALTEEEKSFFCAVGTASWSEKVYEGYVERIWNREENRPIRYEKVVLQMYDRSGTGDSDRQTIANAVTKVIKAMGQPDTIYILGASHARFDEDLRSYTERQNVIDKAVKEGVADAKKKAKDLFNDILIYNSGRTLCNYLISYGENYAEKLEPAAYQIYSSQPEWDGVRNDVIYGDRVHPTQLGSYMTAAALYSLLYGDPSRLWEFCNAGVRSTVTRVDGEIIRGEGNIALLYNGGEGLEQDEVLKAALEMAQKTQNESLRLKPVKPDLTENGWARSGSSWYYFRDGVPAKGWLQESGKWYYFAPSGTMQTGWQRVGRSWYYLHPVTGRMMTGWIQAGGAWYLLGPDGAMQTGWRKTGGKWYYFDKTGAMCTGWKEVDGIWYYFNADGSMYSGWMQDGGKRYYLTDSGEMATGMLRIGGRVYRFRSDGVWIG